MVTECTALCDDIERDRDQLEAENERLRTLLRECGDERSRLRRELARWRTGLNER